MDRLDCQMIMVLFTFVYVTTFVPEVTNINIIDAKKKDFGSIIEMLRSYEIPQGEEVHGLVEQMRSALLQEVSQVPSHHDYSEL